MLVVTCVSLLQGGGPESDDEGVADPFNGKIKVYSVHLPTHGNCYLLLVSCTKKEEDPDNFSYIQFPFGMIDYKGLQILQTCHEYLALRKRIAEEKAWFKQAKQSCEDLGINIESIYQYFKDRVWSTTCVILQMNT